MGCGASTPLAPQVLPGTPNKSTSTDDRRSAEHHHRQQQRKQRSDKQEQEEAVADEEAVAAQERVTSNGADRRTASVEDASQGRSRSSETGLLSGGTIVVVDTQSVTRRLLQRSLKKEGYNSVLLSSGKDAREYLTYLSKVMKRRASTVESASSVTNGGSQDSLHLDDGVESPMLRPMGITHADDVEIPERIDAILCDILVTAAPGVAFMDWVLSHPVWSEVSVLVMTSRQQPSNVVDRWMSLGIEDYLLKPVKPRTLITKLSRSVERKHQLRKLREKDRQIEDLMRQNMRRSFVKRRHSHSNVSERPAVQMPVVAAVSKMREIAERVQAGDVPEDLAAELTFLSKQLASKDLFRPQLGQDEAIGQDPVAMAFLETQLLAAPDVPDSSLSTPARSAARPSVNDSRSGAIDVQLEDYAIDDELRNRLLSWDFPTFELSDTQLIGCLRAMLEHFGLIRRFAVNERKLIRFYVTVSQRYLDNPYHNFRHAFDVTQTAFVILAAMGAAAYLEKLEILALLLSAICHDIEHTGQNNNFHVATQSELAKTFNDRSVLEMHHCRLMFQILDDPSCSVLQNLNQAQYKALRSLVISLILATDMQHHFENMSKIKTRLQNGKMKVDNPEDRRLVATLVMKCADISNVAKTFEVAHEWAKRVSDEFFMQGDLERSKGMEPAMFLDRTKTNYVRNTLGFVDFAARPTFQVLASFLPATNVCLDNIESNSRRLDRLVEAESPTSD